MSRPIAVTWAGMERVGANHLSTSDLREIQLAFMALSSIRLIQADVPLAESVIQVLAKSAQS
ncbi:hypothetical protein BG58_04890 [Caballeronia jiangsuensis]|nr:hypothetical protein BG58_04890 [Caballeronia jiangsuensis]